MHCAYCSMPKRTSKGGMMLNSKPVALAIFINSIATFCKHFGLIAASLSGKIEASLWVIIFCGSHLLLHDHYYD